MKNSGQFRKGVRSNPKNEFKPGMTPWNKDKRGYMGANATSFKPGNIPPGQLPLGTVTRLLNKGKPEYNINIDWQGNRKHHNSYKWYLWEVDNEQDRPPGHVLWIINQNPDDIRIENLELITRAELVRRNRSRKAL